MSSVKTSTEYKISTKIGMKFHKTIDETKISDQIIILNFEDWNLACIKIRHQYFRLYHIDYT